MAKGYNANKERLETINALGKALAKRAGFACEWCASKDELRPWDYRPDQEPVEENLALLCGRCRELAEGKKAAANELHALRNALWSNLPAVAEGVARVLARSREPWVRDAIEESLIDEALKAELVKGL
jgi:hypothetical protein